MCSALGTSGKAILEGGSDDQGTSTEAQGRAIIEVLGRDKRNEVLAAVFAAVLAAVYMVSTDVSQSVRQAAVHVWKTIVVNTRKTRKEIMPGLMNTLISSLASSSSERRQVAGRSLGELVRKLGERVLPSIIPILLKGLKEPSTSRRQVSYRNDTSGNLLCLQDRDAKKETFRKYLESSGVLDALTKVLFSLYEENDKPSSAME